MWNFLFFYRIEKLKNSYYFPISVDIKIRFWICKSIKIFLMLYFNLVLSEF